MTFFSDSGPRQWLFFRRSASSAQILTQRSGGNMAGGNLPTAKDTVWGVPFLLSFCTRNMVVSVLISLLSDRKLLNP